MQEFLRIAKALGDEARLRALLALKEEELCLCQLVSFDGFQAPFRAGAGGPGRAAQGREMALLPSARAASCIGQCPQSTGLGDLVTSRRGHRC